MSWNDASVDLLRKCWADGLSASQCARVIFAETRWLVSRNAVIGKVHRMGLAGRDTPQRLARHIPGTRSRKSVAPTPIIEAPIVELPAITLENGSRVTIANVTDKQCKWPIGDPQHEDFHLCGHPSVTGSPYCIAHSRKAYNAGVTHPRRDEAAEELAEIYKRERVFA